MKGGVERKNLSRSEVRLGVGERSRRDSVGQSDVTRRIIFLGTGADYNSKIASTENKETSRQIQKNSVRCTTKLEEAVGLK